MITGNRAQSGNCQVIIRRDFNQTTITEVSAGEYLVVTHGEIIEKRCQGSAGEKSKEYDYWKIAGSQALIGHYLVLYSEWDMYQLKHYAFLLLRY